MSKTSGPEPGPGGEDLPDWALGQAMNDVDEADTSGRDERARES